MAEARLLRLAQRHGRSSRVQGLAALILPVLLTGCPLSDKYFVGADPGSGGRASGGSGAAGGSSTGTGGQAVGTGGQAAGAAGVGDCGASCLGSCCNGVCTDLTTDAAHCGACDVACSVGRTCVASACKGGWVSMAPPPSGFVARDRAAAVSFNGKLFIFGGVDRAGFSLNSAAIYDPRSDSWSLVAIEAMTPAPRQMATAIWTGSKILVAGGTNGLSYYKSAALYDPEFDRWETVSSSPIARAAAHGSASGASVLLAGGLTTGGGAAASADVYDVEADSWRATPDEDVPGAILGAAWAFSGDELFVYGGTSNGQRTNDAFHYSLAEDAWSSLPRGPAARSGAFGAADETGFYVWGGRDDNSFRNDGASFGASWTTMTQTGAPSPRWVLPRQSGWAFSLAPGKIAFLGGQDQNTGVLQNGGVYQSGVGWTAIPAWPSGEQHLYPVCALVGKEIILWGGTNGVSPTATGERWAP